MINAYDSMQLDEYYGFINYGIYDSSDDMDDEFIGIIGDELFFVKKSGGRYENVYC